MTGRTRPNESRSQPYERQLSSVSNTTTDEYDLLVEENILPYEPPTLHDSDEDDGSSVGSDSETPDPSLELSSSADVDPDALLQLMSDQGTPTLHAIGGHSPLLDDDDSDHDSSDSSLLLPDSATTVSKQSSSLPQAPTIIRVLYLGCATENDKAVFLKKLSEGLAEIFLQRQPEDLKTEEDISPLPKPVFSSPTVQASASIFKERKFNVLPLSTTSRLFDQHGEDPVETYEDNGLAIIEADFTRSGNRTVDVASTTNTIYDYVIRRIDHQLSNTESATSSHHSCSSQQFDGYVFPDETPDGVDLVVYFYSGLDNDEERQTDTEDEMILLWKLRQLGIPVLPMLSSLITSRKKKNNNVDVSVNRDEQANDLPISVSSGSTGSGTRRRTSPIRTSGRHRPHDQHKSNADYNQIMMENRTYLSNTLAEYRIQCLDVLNLEIGRPSFHRRSHRGSSDTHKTANGIAGDSNDVQTKDWETSSLMPAPWQILTVEQFAGVDKRAVYEALKKSREMAVKRETVREIIRARQKPISGGEKTSQSSDAKSNMKRAQMKEAIIRCIIGVIIPFVIMFVLLQGSTTSTLHLSNSTTVGPPAMAKLHPMWSALDPSSKTHLFLVEVFDQHGRPSSLGPDGVKLKTFRLNKDGGEHTSDMAELGTGQYMIEVTSPCYQDENTVAGMQVEITTNAGIQVQDSPVILTGHICGSSNTNGVRSDFQKKKSTPPPASPPPQARFLRTLRKPWHKADMMLLKVKAVSRSSIAVRMFMQVFQFVHNAIGFLWDEAGGNRFLHYLPTGSSSST